MKTCPTCGRNWSKNLHNWSEVMAGLFTLLMILPIIAVLYPKYPFYMFLSVIGLISVYIWCIIHLYSEVRWQR